MLQALYHILLVAPRSVLWCEAVHTVQQGGLLYSKFADAMKGDY